MHVIGVDLSGPGNPENTSVGVFRAGKNVLDYLTLIVSATDQVLYEETRTRLSAGDVCVGLDAPLSYGSSGGQRESDASLRRRIVEVGLRPGSVMAPTAPRMAYLTLRGVAVARGLHLLGGPGRVKVVETHPGAAMALGGAPVEAVRGFRDDLRARETLLQWLTDRGVRGIPNHVTYSDHSVAAFAAAWAAWRWTRGESAWRWEAAPPHHPFEFAC